MVIFHSYVSLTEGKSQSKFQWTLMMKVKFTSKKPHGSKIRGRGIEVSPVSPVSAAIFEPLLDR
jgi:hypothetical protein